MDERNRPVGTKTEPTTEVVDFVPSNDITPPQSTSVIPSPPKTQDQATHDPAIQGQAIWGQASQSRPNEPQANLETLKTQKDEEQPHTEEQDAPDGLPSNEKNDVPNEVVPVVDPESREDKGKGPASPEIPLNPELLTVPKIDDTPEDTISPGDAPSRKSFFGRIVTAKLPQWPTKATTNATPTSGDGTIETGEKPTEGKNDDEKQHGVERDDKEGPSFSKKLLDQGDRTGTGEAKEAADEKAAVEKKAENVKKQAKKAEEKAALEKKLEDEKKQAEIDLWENSCKLEVLSRSESNHPTVDIVAIHDLDETPKTAWVFIPPVSAQKAVRTLLENDLESKRSSLDRNRHLQLLAKVTEESNKRRGSVNRDTTPGFKDGKITPEGRRNKVNDFLSTVDADSSAAVDPPAATKEAESAPPAAPTTFSSEAGPSNAASPREEESQAKKTTAAASSTKDLDPKGGISGKEKKENEGTLTKRGKSGRRKVRKSVLPDPLLPTDHVPPIPLVPAAATIPPKLVVPEPGVDDRTQTKDTGGSRVSEKDPRSGRGSTEIDGSVRKRHVHLLLDNDMIPGSFPGARILSYTYPIMSATTSKEYLDNAARRLLDSLVIERADERYNSVPIVFIGYGFGGLVLQKLLLLAAKDHEEKSKGAAQIINMAAGLVVLDTPFPVVPSKNQTEKDPFPPDPNARQQHILGRLKASGNTLNVRTLWESFNDERVRHKLPLNWLYTLAAKDGSSVPKVQPKRPISDLAQIGIFCMAMVSDSKRRLGRFPGPQDEIYIRLVSQMQRCLLFKSAAIKELESLLTHLIKQPDVLVHVKDEQGKSALHYAAEAPNSPAVTILINLGEAEVLQRDNLGQTPLHACIRKAVATNPTDKDGQKPYKDIIKRLMDSSPDVNQTDNDKKTAWDYAPELTWIQDLRINRDPFSGRSTSNETETVKSVRPLDKPSLKRKACEDTLGLLAEFYLLTDKHTTHEKFTYEKPSIFDMIYDEKEEGVLKILDRSRPKRLTNEIRRCRWVHLPANNEQWVQDLFLTLKIKDNSVHGQREGSKRSAFYLIPQVNKYKQICEQKILDTQSDGNQGSRSSSDNQILKNTVGSDPSKERSIDPSQSETQQANSKEKKDKQPAQSPTEAATPEPVKTRMVDKDAIAVFMPILAYETSKFRKQMTNVIETPLQELKEQGRGTESLILQGYLSEESQSPMHCRRTLDQFSYYMLDTTESRDRDQVIYRWGRKKLKKEKKTGDAPLLMVDQLWFWVLQDGTLITSFPNTWDVESTYSLKTALNQDLRNKEVNNKRKLIGSVDDLLHWIIRHSVDFLRREGPSDIKFQVAFQSSINNIADQEAEQFKSFKDITTTLNKKDLREEQKSEEIEKLFKLHVETRLLIEIKDIQDELNIVSSVLGQQKEILENLYKLCSPDENTGVDSNVTENSNPKTFSGLELIADNQTDEPDSRNKVNQRSILHHDGLKEREKRKEKVKVHFPDERFKKTEMNTPVLRNPSLIDDNLAIVKGNIRVVDDMIAYAKQVHTSITDLLDLKQRQANAWEARFSREGSQQSQRQGNIMLVFTLVTIVFLPLSFISSFLALGVTTFPKDPKSGNTAWPLHTLALLLFGISALVFVPLVIIALSVNRIKSSFRAWFFGEKQPEKVKKTAGDEESGEKEEDDKSDDEGDDSSTIVAGSETSAEKSSSEDQDEDEEESLYAPIFGRWKFHTYVPIIRRLWERQIYLNTDSDDEYLNDEDIVQDYPLHHFLAKISPWSFIRQRLDRRAHRRRSYDFDDGDSLPPWMRVHGRLPRRRSSPRGIFIEEIRGTGNDSDGPARRWMSAMDSDDEAVVIGRHSHGSQPPPSRVNRLIAPVQRIFRRGQTDDNSNASYVYESESSRSSHARGHIRDSGSGSGSDTERPTGVAERLGTAISVPFRRLFVRRRRSHDVESIAVDD